MSLTDSKICFVTLAFGEKYRDHALTHAADIRTLTHNTPFVILTDRPEVFARDDSLTLLPSSLRYQLSRGGEPSSSKG
ncbi:hypothetical protein [Microcystis aeruginosa]|jgi:hypothetical protein|uniref:Uncharacterized protein n=1 Tax=Microcystis aeruginosa Ma_QC_C_20070703_M131 TaxID=2486263 RepID=A0A551Y1M9_MICAE|nr:hypothetical protein [Microcystis aeruginosa]MDB9389417.1 hypothetical protein [Microcystis aeruginosa CS-579]TRT54870.1 MAG: hypothetical protein EWV85_10455 [Microcystis aeruginosa Ma_QC_C_20070703_M131]